jgi:hypothetical protein
VIPLLVIFIPLFTYLSSANTFLLRLKFAGIYEELYLLEQNASNLAMREQNFKELELIEQRVANMKVSALAARDFYDLKGHIGEVRNRLKLLT